MPWEKEFCEEHNVWWQPTATIDYCPVCELLEDGSYIPEPEHEEEIQKRDDEYEKLEKENEKILEAVCNLRDDIDEKFSFESKDLKKAEMFKLVQEIAQDHFEACNLIVIGDI